jgi:hypothetical protein
MQTTIRRSVAGASAFKLVTCEYDNASMIAWLIIVGLHGKFQSLINLAYMQDCAKASPLKLAQVVDADANGATDVRLARSWEHIFCMF